MRLIEAVRGIAIEAGELILSLRDRSLASVKNKIDDSPVTEADLASNDLIVKRLDELKIAPVISEEGTDRIAPHGAFWLVDPLDGTKDFIGGKRSFVVNIALIENRIPVVGAIYAPMLNELFWAETGQGAFKVTRPGPKRRVYNDSDRIELRALASGGATISNRMQKVLDALPIKSVERFGSALKMCRVAEGSADIYTRFGPTHEWDTAAGQIILKEAGCKLIDIETGRDVEYGKPDFKNNGFIACRANIDYWQKIRKLRDEI